MAQRDGPSGLVDEEVNATLRPNQPYRIPVNGWTQEIEKLNGTDRFTMCNEYRRPNNAVLVVAGDAEPETVKALAAKTYGKVARGPDLPPRNRPVEPD
ncbi:insulinase family protein [Mesorhizobium sp. M0320]|uniref:insulinase family protein n=1 Tax=unclassified Mesorhizobium TaxID=325217 RepID=UPI001FD957FF|nr:insulinase family protein [Mesorhizobium sp. LSJC255A00]